MADIFLSMLEITAISSAIILAVFIFRMLLAKRIKPGVMGMLWALVLLRLCLPFTMESPVHLPQPAAPIQQAVQTVQQPVVAGQTNNITPDIDYGLEAVDEPETLYKPQTAYELTPQVNTAYEPVTMEQSVAVSTLSIDWLAAAAYVWLAGAAAILLTAVCKGASFGRKVRRCEEYEEAVRIADGIREALNIRRNVPVRICGDITAPVLFGYFRPQVLLPESCQNANSDTLRCILTHELCHVKRHDILKGYIWLIAKAAHWFNPFVWFAYITCKDDIEISCDDMVLKLIGSDNRFMYTQSLIDMFRYYRQKPLPLAVPLFESKPKLTERVIRMLKPHKHSKATAALSVLLVLVMLIAGFTTACAPAAQTVDGTNPSSQSAAPQPTASRL